MPPRPSRDDLGAVVDVPAPARRVVSLVPSLTEAIALTRPDALVGATDWCTHPADLDVPRVRGTKNPDLAAIRALEPDLVVCNREENRELDVRRLREAGVPVWVSVIETLPQALTAMERIFDEALGWGVPDWLEEVERRWDRPVPPVAARVAVPIWRDPWMVVGRHTFTDDLLRRLGWQNVYADGGPGADRYPTVSVADLEAARSRRGAAARRALRVHRGRRSGGVRRHDPTGQRTPADLVRPVAARHARRPDPAPLTLPGPRQSSGHSLQP